MSLAHLHVHSHFSLMEGTASVRDLCQRAQEQGHEALALTDTNALYGLPAFLEACRDFGLRPIIGAELRHQGERVVALVRSEEGFRNLCRVISALQCEELPGNLTASLPAYVEGLMFLSDQLPLLLALRKAGAQVYAEAVGGPTNVSYQAGKQKIPVAATNAVRLLQSEDQPLHRLLRAIHHNTSLSKLPPSEVASADRWFWGPEQFHRAFEALPEALINTASIAAACQYQGPGKRVIFPHYDGLPEGTEALQYLRTLAYDGARNRYGQVKPVVRQRLEKELGIIAAKGFADYFLVVREIALRATRTCGRGSGAASLVAYSLGITNVDPIKYNLYFERFLNMGRKDPPDIDMDFCHDERDAIIEWVFDRFGRDRVAMVCNHLTFQPRMAIREVAKVEGLPDGEISARTKKLPYHAHEDSDPVELIEELPALRDTDFPEPWPRILRTAWKLIGMPRHLSVHPGGTVITPGPITDYAPIQPSAKGPRVLQWEKDGTEDMGLVKIDILSNRNGLPTVRDALEMIRENEGIVLDSLAWKPTEDQATIDMLARGSNVGIFYVESPATRQLQIKANKGDFEHLVIHSSIIRPAANTYINEYVRRLRALPEPPPSLHPLLDPILAESYGIMVYQEHVSQAAEALAGFPADEADNLRRVMSKKDVKRKLEHYRAKFTAGALANGVTEEVIAVVWGMIESFAGYSFCKPHSASYAQVSFQAAYLRCHYPAEFLAGVLSNEGGFYSPFAYLSEARRLGIQVLGPDANLSRVRYRGRRRKIRIGFMAISGLRDEAKQTVVAERDRGGNYTSLENLLARATLVQADAEALIDAGACDSLEQGVTRPQMHWKAAKWFHEHPVRKERAPLLSLFAEEGNGKLNGAPPAFREFGDRDILIRQWERLGYLIDRHPLEMYEEELRRIPHVKGCDLPRYAGQWVTMIGWHVTSKTVRTYKHEAMQFVSFEDTTALYETVLFPQAFERFIHMLDWMHPYILRGRAQDDFGCVTLQVEQVEKLVPQQRRGVNRPANGVGNSSPLQFRNLGDPLELRENVGVVDGKEALHPGVIE